ncbi:MAG: urease subunit beta [Alistipes sp.]|nr:urease subunit beta [Alistipes sp.]
MKEHKTTGRKSASTIGSLYPAEKGFMPSKHVAVGGTVFGRGDIAYNENRQTVKLEVVNTGDRPIQVGSHFHFFEVNRYLRFDRDAAFGCHLNIPATTAVRFEPGDKKSVELVAYAGKRRIMGFNGLVNGYAGDEDAPTFFPARIKAMERMHTEGFATTSKPVTATTTGAIASKGAANSDKKSKKQ